MTKFERSPMKTMIKSELLRNSELTAKELARDVRIIANLQNIKHSMKADLNDAQICNLLFN